MNKHPVILIGLMAVALSGGCSASPEIPPGPYASDIKAVMENTDSEYIKAILEDGVITEEEITDARSMVVQCAGENGIYASYRVNEYGDAHLTTGVLPEQQEEILVDCQDRYISGIDMLYWSMKTDPTNLGQWESIAQCLIRQGLAPEGFTGKDLENLYIHEFGFNQPPTPKYTPDPPIVLPGGATMTDPTAMACQLNPSFDLP